MRNVGKLSSLEEGQKGCVSKILMAGSMRRRLMDLGLVEGTEVQCVHKSPFGDPTVYMIRGAAIALRHEDAKNIFVS